MVICCWFENYRILLLMSRLWNMWLLENAQSVRNISSYFEHTLLVFIFNLKKFPIFSDHPIFEKSDILSNLLDYKYRSVYPFRLNLLVLKRTTTYLIQDTKVCLYRYLLLSYETCVWGPELDYLSLFWAKIA